MKGIEVVERVLRVKAWQKGAIRAPHKPLLLLYALAKFIAGQKQIYFAEAEEDLRNLLSDFGPPRHIHRPEYPFWRLQNDKVWMVTVSLPVEENRPGDVGRRVLIDADARGSFSEVVLDALNNEPALVKLLIKELLVNNFPETIHEDSLRQYMKIFCKLLE